MGRAGARTEHTAIALHLTRLTRWTEREGPLRLTARDRAALPAFLRRWGGLFGAHFRAEEKAWRNGIRRGLPPELACPEDVCREREAVAAVIDLLRCRCRKFLDGDPSAEADVETAVLDLAELWRRHVRRAEVRNALMGPAPTPGRTARRPDRSRGRRAGGHR